MERKEQGRNNSKQREKKGKTNQQPALERMFECCVTLWKIVFSKIATNYSTVENSFEMVMID